MCTEGAQGQLQWLVLWKLGRRKQDVQEGGQNAKAPWLLPCHFIG
jgi:hypothetical protein